ncbi:hypothetical protein [Pseudolysobacter antarcticus]|uniref:hypothetical protein n=1 Tax=Pseudolysobacter antarcticus TaxID=2511995 RepID=UPI001F5D108E|nr:hypothetical protein [Pseudolysobacter antarcticus]
MNIQYVGDSYDIVKRFFCEALRALKYTVYIDPMSTDEWKSSDTRSFYKFLGVQHADACDKPGRRTALLFDPDTGLSEKKSKKHLSFVRLEQALVEQSLAHGIVFVFDQSFSRGSDLEKQKKMRHKLDLLNKGKCFGFYYNSHASFLFASSKESHLLALQRHLKKLGLPEFRIRTLGNLSDS